MGGGVFKHIYPNVGLSLHIRKVWVLPPLLLTSIFPNQADHSLSTLPHLPQIVSDFLDCHHGWLRGSLMLVH